jgi:hypothetical protein
MKYNTKQEIEDEFNQTFFVDTKIANEPLFTIQNYKVNLNLNTYKGAILNVGPKPQSILNFIHQVRENDKKEAKKKFLNMVKQSFLETHFTKSFKEYKQNFEVKNLISILLKKIKEI